MKLYHLRYSIGLGASVLILLAGCAEPLATQASITVNISADGKSFPVQVPVGSTVQQALEIAGLRLGLLDKTEPAMSISLSDGASVQVIRVEESFEIEEETIPFEQLRQPTELLPEGQLKLDPIQKGEPGVLQKTYRVLTEDGQVVSRVLFKTEIIKPPVPQIVLVGVQPVVEHFEIPGRLVYLFNGEAWVLEGKTSNRKPAIRSGDLDGRVFSLSADGSWLLYTRHSKEEDQVNELWAADLTSDPIREVDLNVSNIIHFADWIPGSTSRVIFSTVEPRTTAPGWQANNDLYALSFSTSGWVTNWREKPILEANSGGIYGWWGTTFAWSPDGAMLAYARPDQIGLVDLETGVLTATLDILPLQTGSDWAWVPGLSWGADSRTLFSLQHIAEEGAVSPEQSSRFDVIAIPLEGGRSVSLVQQTGMFGYPVASPVQPGLEGENAYQIAYLQAIFPTQSETSNYRLMVMDRDGSNRRLLFPPEDQPGLNPQQVVWSSAPLPDQEGYGIAFLYQDNLWIVDASNGLARQVTGDGLVSRIGWK